MWAVVDSSILLPMCSVFVLILHVSSDWLITKECNMKSYVWAAVTKLGMWVEVDSSITHILNALINISFAYLFWLAYNKKASIRRTVWATVAKLGRWVAASESTQILSMCKVCAPNNADLQSTSWHSSKGGPRCVFWEYSERTSREPRNSSFAVVVVVVSVVVLFIYSVYI